MTEIPQENKDVTADLAALESAYNLLEAQRLQAQSDICTLREMKMEALQDSDKLFEKLKSGDFKAPAPQNVVKMPAVNLAKYSHSVSLQEALNQGIVNNIPTAQQVRLFDDEE